MKQKLYRAPPTLATASRPGSPSAQRHGRGSHHLVELGGRGLGAVIANYGAGMILPTLITWAVTLLPAAQRGTGTGLWMTASFLGQFLSPLVVLGLRHATGSLSAAILAYAVACALSALIAAVCLWAAPAPLAAADRA
ncbi:MAG: hypothetical protein ACRESY_08900 [Steroidobacteraceae bacterium]